MSQMQKDHFQGLDFLRGVAALGVAWFHLSSRLDIPLLSSHGYLAVDFFFVLSGFVMARAYCKRLESRRISFKRFALMRLIRFMPLVILGTLLAALVEFGRPGVADQHQHIADTILATVCGILLVPIIWTTTTLNYGVFPLNGTTWTLFLEVIANAAFAVWARSRLGLRMLSVVIVISAAFLFWGVLETGAMGFGAVIDHFWFGFARVAFSFSCGAVLFRFRNRAAHIPFSLAIALLCAVMMTPPLSGVISQVFDTLCVFIVLPWIVWTASTAQVPSFAKPICAWSGDLSYPIYALHFAIIRVFGVAGNKLQPNLFGRLGLVFCATIVIIAISTFAYRFLDLPIRRWLTLTLIDSGTDLKKMK